MKHYRAIPLRGIEGDETIVALGLSELVKQAQERFGLTTAYPSVRSNLTAAGTVFRCEGGYVRIELAPDADIASDVEQSQAVIKEDKGTDYQAKVYINYKDAGFKPGEDSTEHKSQTIRAKGLMSLMEEATQYVACTMGGIPPSMEADAVALRIPNMRSQMSKSRGNEHATYSVPFPTLKEPYWKAPNNWDVRVFVVIDAEFETPRERKPLVRR